MSDVTLLFDIHPQLFIIISVIIGLIFGSFINVVAYRLPIMLERQWRIQCRDLLEMPNADEENDNEDNDIYNLMVPASSCPQCETPIKPWHNIPIFGWLYLRGECSSCGTRISAQYPIVEAFGGVLAGIVAWHFGPSTEALLAMAFTWTLLALSVIDLREQLLPDSITLPLLWAGLLISLSGVFVEIHSALIGAIAGYTVLWIVYWVFRLLTGKEGMGYGDFKILAAMGAWMGWQALPIVIVMSSVVGAIVGILLLVTGLQERGQRIPFGPFLASAGWITLLWGKELLDMYYSWFGIL